MDAAAPSRGRLIVDDIARAADDPAHRDRVAVVHRSAALTYGELWRAIRAAQTWFAAELPVGARIALVLESSPALVVALYAATAAGLIAVPLDAAIHPRNLDHVLADCEPGAILSSARHLEQIAALPAAARSPRLVQVDDDRGGGPVPGAVRFEELVAMTPGSTPRRPADEEPAVIAYTTGTTGLRKGAMLSHRALTAAAININTFMRLADGVVELVCMPLSHSFGFARLRCALAARGTVILVNGLNRPGEVLDAIASHGVTSIGLVPMACRMLVDHYRARLAAIGPQLRFVELGSDFLDPRHKELLLELLPEARICMHYGLTEASRSTFIELRSERDHLDTIGRPTPNVEVAILDGEICVRGDTVMLGYWGKPALTAEALRGGWLHTGDLGARDQDGYLRLLGRRSDVIKVAGFSVAPREVEAVLMGHPLVAEAAVAPAAADGSSAATLTAFVVARGPAPDLRELRRLCRAELEPYKVPARFVVVPSLPRTASGKLIRGELALLDPTGGIGRGRAPSG